MKKIIAETIKGLAPSSVPTGQKLEPEPTGMAIESRCLGAATTAPSDARTLD